MPINISAPQQAIQSGTHKNLRSPCNIAQSIQLSNIVLVNLRPLSRVSSYGSYSLSGRADPNSASNPMFDVNLSSLTPNIKLVVSYQWSVTKESLATNNWPLITDFWWS